MWTIKNNFEEADFWLINKGSEDKLGLPVKEFQPYLTGIKCPAYILPSYGYYLCVYLHSIGVWKAYAMGTLSYKHLRISDVRNLFSQIKPEEKHEEESHIAPSFENCSVSRES